MSSDKAFITVIVASQNLASTSKSHQAPCLPSKTQRDAFVPCPL